MPPPDAPDPDDPHIAAARLLARVAVREMDAFSQLYDRFCGVLHATTLNLLSEAAEAEDVLQEVFMKIWNRAHQYSPDQGSAVSWLLTLARNSALDRLRSKKRNMAAIGRAAADPIMEPAGLTNAYDQAVASETAQAVRGALAGLPLEQREVLNLAFMRGLTHEEIAQTLSQPVGTVKSRLRRGMARMKNALTMHHSHHQ